MSIFKIAFAGAISTFALLAVPAASEAATVDIDGITVTNSGRISPAAPVLLQPGYTSATANFVGEIETGNPGHLPNPGFDPYGSADTTHHWWNIYRGSASFAVSGTTLDLLWGSPNYNVPYRSNSLSFYSGSTLLGSVLASDLYTSFSGITNDGQPGYLLSFTPDAGRYDKVVAGIIGSSSDFEFAFLGVPEPSTWAMIVAGFGGLGMMRIWKMRKTVATA